MLNTNKKFALMSQDKTKFFDDNGYLIIPSVLDKKEIELLLEASDKLMYSNIEKNREYGVDGWQCVRNCIEFNPEIFKLVSNEVVLSYVVQLLSFNIHVISSQCIYLKPSSKNSIQNVRVPNNTGWHRDIYGMNRDLGYENTPKVSIKCMYFLSDMIDPCLGMTYFSPKSHLLKDMLRIPNGKIDPKEVVQPKLKVGDVLIFENRTWHAVGLNKSNLTRKCITIAYGYRWIKPLDYQEQPNSLMSICDDLDKQLVGFAKDIDSNGKFVNGLGAQLIKKWCELNDLHPQEHFGI